MEQDLCTNDRIERAYSETSLFTFWKPREAGRDGLPVRWDSAEEEDLVQELDEMQKLRAGHGVAHILSCKVWVPVVQQAFELQYFEIAVFRW
jgi:hypothetical protein